MKKIYPYFYAISLVLLSPHAWGFIEQSMLLNREKIAFYTPQVVNPKYFSFEFGFLTTKKIESIGYSFNAYADAYIAEESYTTQDNLRAGALGFKGGVILPTQNWIPLYLQFSFGFAKTALHEDPWFGKKDKSESIRDLFLIEAGAMYRYKNFFLRYIYHLNNLKYFTKKSFISLGVNF